jgi:hypothetical protein
MVPETFQPFSIKSVKEWNQQIIDLRKLFLGFAESGKEKDAQAFNVYARGSLATTRHRCQAFNANSVENRIET